MNRAVQLVELLEAGEVVPGVVDEYPNKREPWQLSYNPAWINKFLGTHISEEEMQKIFEKIELKVDPVNHIVTIPTFRPDLEAQADLAELEQDIHSTGFYHNKAKNIIACCQKLLQDYNGEVPSDIEQLTALAGVGRKTANVVRGNWYHIPSVVVDTHVKRVSNLLGLTKNEDPVKIEFDLMQLVPKDKWIDINTQMIAHGRKICIARRPKCQECFLLPYCTGGKALEKEKKKKEKKA